MHERFGDPVTIRTLWTDEPMVLFSGPEAVREIFRLDPAIAPAGQSWEFVRPFAGEHSILVLDGEEHLRERRLMQGPFHGERMRGFRPLVAELAERELGSWSGRVTTLDRMKELTLETILRVVFGARDDEAAGLRDAVHGTLDIVRSMPRMIAMSLVQRDLGPRSPWGQFRLAVEHFDDLLLELVARRRAEPAGDSVLALLLEQRDADGNPPSDRHLRDQLVALLAAGHDTSAASLAWAFERLARHPAVQARLREGDPDYLDAVVKEVLRARPALTIAPAAAARAGRDRRAETARRRARGRLHLARAAPRGPLAAGGRVPAGALARGRAGDEPDVVDPVRRRRAPLRRSAVRRDGDARGAAGGRSADDSARPTRARARAPQRPRRDAAARRRGDRRAGLGLGQHDGGLDLAIRDRPVLPQQLGRALA